MLDQSGGGEFSEAPGPDEDPYLRTYALAACTVVAPSAATVATPSATTTHRS